MRHRTWMQDRKARSGVRAFGRSLLRPAVSSLAVAGAFCAMPGMGQTLPGGAVAIHGQASVSAPTPQQLVVTTQNGAGTSHSAIDWQSFSISAGSSVRFNQPGSTSLSINRVVGGNPSAILGNLSSNGRLVLVNPSGITVGAGAVIDTAGFTASALRMSDADALAGRLRFGDAAASMGGASGITVDGRITARDGDVVLVAPHIEVGGSALLQAPNGSTILAAGQQVEITGRGLEGITLLVQARENEARNLGRLEGNAVGIFAGTLRHSGEIQATTASLEGGRVVLRAVGDAYLEGDAKVMANGARGGQVDVFGARVALTDQAQVDASGSAGGGQIRIGGDFQGKNPAVPNADKTYVGSGTALRADATASGDGGRIIVWADSLTKAHGTVSARGGSQGGNGGFVEISGKQQLVFDGAVNLQAAAGLPGTLLLDPDFIDVSNGGTSVIGDVNLFAVNPGQSLLISPATLNAVGGNVMLQATNDITFNDPVNLTTAGASLTALAGGIISVGASITTNAGPITLYANAPGSGGPGSSGSAVYVNAPISSNGGNITLRSDASDTGGNAVYLNANILAGAGTVTLQAPSDRIEQVSGSLLANALVAIADYEINLAQAGNNIASNVDLSTNTATSATSQVLFTNSAGNFNLSGATAKGDITIITAGAMTTDGAVQSTTGNISITTSGNLGFGDDVSAAGTLTLISGGGLMSQSGGSITAAGASTFNAGGNDVLFGSITNDFSTVSVTGGQITLVDATALTITSRTQPINGNLYLEARTGALTLPAGAIDTGTGQLSLLSGAGAFTTPGALNGSDLLLKGSASLTLAHNITASGNMSLFSGGTLLQSAGTISSAGGTLLVDAISTLTVQGGAGSPTAMVSVGDQTITAADILVVGGTGGSSASAAIKMTGTAGTQDITVSNGITMTGGANGGGVGAGNYAAIISNGNQSITVGNGGLTLTAGGGTGVDTGNAAILEHNGGAGTTQSITVNGTGSIVATGGSSSLTGMSEQDASRATILSDNGDSQTITFTGGGAGRAITLTGGTNGSDAYAEIYAGLGTQIITGAGLITLTGGASGGGLTDGLGNTHGNLAAISADLNNQTIGANGILLQGGSGGINNLAALVAGGSQAITVGAGGLTLGGGSGSTGQQKNAAIVIKTSDVPATSQVITVNSGGNITMQGGSSSDTGVGFDSNLLGLSNGSFAMIRSDGTSQLIEFTAAGSFIVMNGGTVGSNNFANILTATGSQTIAGDIAAHAPTIYMTGGGSGGVTNEGNRALIGADVGNQVISASGITLTGGTGGTENLAQIRQGSASTGLGATQTVTLEGVGSLDLFGGSGVTNLARLQAYGTSQTIGFTTGGALTLTGGTGASNNFARIQAVNGNQTISGDAELSITGGASGGADLNGNFADIRANGVSAVQTILAGNITLLAGATGQENFAGIIGANQAITATGDVSLTGGGSATSLDGTSGGGSRIGGLGSGAPGPTNLVLNVGNNLTLTGGSVAGVALGSNTVGGQPTNITVVAGGDVSLNPGSGLGSGARIGSPLSSMAAGDISITAGGDFSLSGGTAGETAIRTLGAVNIDAATATVGNSIIGGTVRLQASSGVSINTSSGEAGSISASATSGDSLKIDAGSSFTNSTGAGALNVAGAGRWLVFSTDPGLDTRGGLVYDFKQYNVAFGGTVLGTGNGFLYTLAPTVTALLGGTITKTYDGSDTATVSAGNLSVSGALAGDVVSVSGPSTGTYDTRHVGTAKTVTLAPGGISVSAVDGSAPVYGYAVAGGPVTGAVGTITPASLTVGTSDISKSYDGTTSAVGAPVVTSGSLFGGDSLVGGSFNFLDKNVGTGKTVSVAGVSVNDGNSGSNYSVSYVNNLNSSITALAAATWTGSADTSWTNPSNWVGGVVPDLGNVQSVTIPAGAGSVVFDAAAGTTSLQSLNSARPISVTGGNLQIGSLLQTASYSQSGGLLSGAGTLSVSDSFLQTGGAISMGTISINQSSGNLTVANLNAPLVALAAPTGAIGQSGPIVASTLVTASLAGTSLTSSGNQVGAWTAGNSGSGDIVFVGTGPLLINTVANAGGNIDIVNTGGISTAGAVTAPNGNVSITANSPLTIGAGGVLAGGDIMLTASNLTSAGNLTLNGPLVAGNMVDLLAGAAMVQNFAVFGANGVTAAAGTGMTYGPLAITNNPPILYTVGGVAVAPPPTVLSSSLQAPGDILVTFLDLFQQAVDGQLGDLLELDADGNLRRKFLDDLVSEEEVCR
jgi:filamentous hemagglutinin family protein